MASRPSWQGFLKFNLISVPVKGYNAVAGGSGKIGFHLLHKGCNGRIRYQKVCPIHGEVSNDEIVSGYEVAKGQYVIVEKDERGELRAEDEKAIAIDAFVAPAAIDPIYFSGRTYYLVPDGKVAQKPYAVLLDALRAEGRQAVAQVVFSGKSQVTVVRPYGRLLAMSLLTYPSEIKSPSAFEDDIQAPDVSAEERRLAKTLIAAATAEDFDLTRYKDQYADKLVRLIEGKTRHEERAVEPGQEEPAVINLMDALKQSLNRARKDKTSGKGSPRPRKASRGGKRKTG